MTQKKLAMIVVDEQLMENLDVEMLQLTTVAWPGRGQSADGYGGFPWRVEYSGTSRAVHVRLRTGSPVGDALLAEQGLFNGSEIEEKWRQILDKNK